jgi:AcrR family transcriptional regulator
MCDDMKVKAAPPKYNSPLRAQQKEQTRELILAAVAAILSKQATDAVTISEVAKVAGVTMRTVFRHFATREELLSAFWRWQLEQTGGQTILGPKSVEGLLDRIREFFEGLDADENLIRAVISSPEGREIRKQANQVRLEKMLDFVKSIVPELPKRERHNMASGIISVSSVLSWLFMRDNCGYDGKRAGEAAAQTVQYIIEAGQARAAALRKSAAG